MEISCKAISRTTRFRDAHRSAAELDALLLARELDKLSLQFPHFRPSINRLTHHVRFQLRSVPEKQKLIRRALRRFERLGLDEITDETGLDNRNVIESLAPMIRDKEIELCLRDGARYRPSPGARTDVLGRQLNSRGKPVNVGVYFRLTATRDSGGRIKRVLLSLPHG
jgi:hypothetical protein